jgi:hypothetical protein
MNITRYEYIESWAQIQLGKEVLPIYYILFAYKNKLNQEQLISAT